MASTNNAQTETVFKIFVTAKVDEMRNAIFQTVPEWACAVFSKAAI